MGAGKRAIEEARLEDPVGALVGFGPKAVAGLAERGVETVEELLWLLPKRYEDHRQVTPVSEVEPGPWVVTEGVVERVRVRRRGRRATVTLLLRGTDGEGRLEAVFWNARGAHSDPRFRVGARLRLAGRADLVGRRARLAHPRVEPSDATARPIVPVYPDVAGLPQRKLAGALGALSRSLCSAIPDAAPAAIRRSRGLIPVGEALAALHSPRESAAPETVAALSRGESENHRRLAYEELLSFQLWSLTRRRAVAGATSPAIESDADLRERVATALGFALTSGQERALDAILSDLASPRPMRRLLQGDVGAGKTAVALAACLAVVESGHQAALMVPTEILAEQHLRLVETLSARLPFEPVLLRGGGTAAERRLAVGEVAEGKPRLVIGTHALIQGDVELPSLGLVVVDEQHRFGVAQRLALARKGEHAPHLLVMTATPIPRSLALTAFGDLDLSTIGELPPGRTPPETLVLPPAEHGTAYDEVVRAADAGARAFVVCPAIDERGEGGLVAAATTYERLRTQLGHERVALVHGRLDADARHAAMERFLSGAAPVLVGTNVVEVGVDVAEATVMVVEGAERFGLAQLHQMRGRVGRGGGASRCFYLHGADLTDEARARLDALLETTDGFALAERDLEIRGPGDLFGHRQSGLPRVALGRGGLDPELLEQAHADATAILSGDPELSTTESRGARRAVDRLASRWSAPVAEEAG